LDEANKAVEDMLHNLIDKPITDRELKKVQNKYEALLLMGQTSALNKAMDLSYFEMLGDANLLNQEIEKYCSITPADITNTAHDIFHETNCSSLFYMAEK
jgi:predicted Zn-dependent peptidase